jgi:isopenicillin-N epimerase
MPEAIAAGRDALRSALREQFLLHPDVIYLNHGSFGACCRPAFDAYQRWQLELERQPVEFLSRRWKDLLRDAREALGAFVGARADDLVFVTNATMGVNIVARSLRLNPGDEVLATDHEYGALDRTWQFVCERLGASYVRAQIAIPVDSHEQTADAVWSRVTPRTRVLFVSHITSPTALILPVEELVRRARRSGILTVIDGAHAPGQIPVDLEALGADFYTANCHKWMCAPKGSAFLYARQEVQPLLDPLVVSWGWRPEEPGPSRFIDEHEWQGTRDLAAFLAVPEAIEFLRAHIWGAVQQDCHRLAAYARAAIGSITGLPQICPEDSSWYAQMASVLLPPCDTERLKQRLLDEYRIEVPVWKGDLPLLRVSVQGYDTKADVDALTSALERLLPDVRSS